MKVKDLKEILDEENYPFFTEEYLEEKTTQINSLDKEIDKNNIILQLLEIKSGIPEFEICGMRIPAPENYFLRKMRGYRKNLTGYVVRGDRK